MLLLFDYGITEYLYILLLFLPLLDTRWVRPGLSIKDKADFSYISLLLVFIAVLLLASPGQSYYFLAMLAFTALPEEWFFRAYLLSRIGFNLRGNIVVSIAFSILHGINQNYSMIFLVFVPSLVFGWVYQQTRNIYINVLLHALSNLVFVIYIKDLVKILD